MGLTPQYGIHYLSLVESEQILAFEGYGFGQVAHRVP
jgi:hypothetical protein